MPDRTAVIDLPSAEFAAARETLTGSIGLATSFASVPLVLSETGVGIVAASGGTPYVQSNTTVNLEDARINQVRLVARAGSSGAGDSLRVMDGATALCSVSLGASVANITGAWTVIKPSGGDRALVLQAVGNGSRTQTVYHAELQLRTLRLVQQA